MVGCLPGWMVAWLQQAHPKQLIHECNSHPLLYSQPIIQQSKHQPSTQQSEPSTKHQAKHQAIHQSINKVTNAANQSNNQPSNQTNG
jgi:hypothetical protein